MSDGAAKEVIRSGSSTDTIASSPQAVSLQKAMRGPTAAYDEYDRADPWPGPDTPTRLDIPKITVSRRGGSIQSLRRMRFVGGLMALGSTLTLATVGFVTGLLGPKDSSTAQNTEPFSTSQLGSAGASGTVGEAPTNTPAPDRTPKVVPVVSPDKPAAPVTPTASTSPAETSSPSPSPSESPSPSPTAVETTPPASPTPTEQPTG